VVGREGSTSRVVAILIVIQFPPLVDREETYLISTSCSREGYAVCKGGRERRENEISQPSQLNPASPLISSSPSFSAADQELSYPYVSKQTSSLGSAWVRGEVEKRAGFAFLFPSLSLPRLSRYTTPFSLRPLLNSLDSPDCDYVQICRKKEFSCSSFKSLSVPSLFLRLCPSSDNPRSPLAYTLS